MKNQTHLIHKSHTAVGTLVEVINVYDSDATIASYSKFPGEYDFHQVTRLRKEIGIILEIRDNFSRIYVNGHSLWVETRHTQPIE